MKFYTASMSVRTDLPCIDITVKSAKDKTFTPSWEMVEAWKSRMITKKQYIEIYTKMMRKSYANNRKEWEEVLNMDVVVFKCYCSEFDFCHRRVLADIFISLGADYLGELTKPLPKTTLEEDITEIKKYQELVKIYTSRVSTVTNMDCINIFKEVAFKPSADMIADYRNNDLTDEEYMKEYYDLMSKKSNKYRKEWVKLLSKDVIVLKCYNESDKWCSPRFFLARILESLGATYVGEIKGR